MNSHPDLFHNLLFTLYNQCHVCSVWALVLHMLEFTCKKAHFDWMFGLLDIIFIIEKSLFANLFANTWGPPLLQIVLRYFRKWLYINFPFASRNVITTLEVDFGVRNKILNGFVQAFIQILIQPLNLKTSNQVFF